MIIKSLWENNPSLVQLLGLCPLLAVSNTASNALGLGLATTLVLIFTNMIVSIVRRWILYDIRIPIYVIIITTVVSIIEIIISVYSFELYQSIGIFIPLIITNCIVISRVEICALHYSIIMSLLDGLLIGLGSTSVLLTLGIIRELLGSGVIFDGAVHILGDWARLLYFKVFNFDTPFLIAILPPGAFISLGCLIACKNIIDQYKKK